MPHTQVLVIGGGTGLTSAWLLENQEGFEVTLIEKSDRLGGHIDTKEYRCVTRMLNQQPTPREIAKTQSLREILFIRHNGSYEIGFCDVAGNYQQTQITDPLLQLFLNKQADGEFLIPDSELDRFNQQLREVKSCQRVTPHIVEAGAEFMGTEESYPLFNKICHHLEVLLKKFTLNMQFDNKDGTEIVLPPPLFPRLSKEDARSRGLFAPHDSTKDKINTIELFNEFTTLVNTKLLTRAAKKALEVDHVAMTLKEFVDQFIASPDFKSLRKNREKFAEAFLYPLLAASWGVYSTDQIKPFIAHYTMNYLSLGEYWHYAPQGLNVYINKMREQCSKTEFKLNTEVEKLEPISIGSGVKYKVRLKNGLYLTGEDSNPKLFDVVIMATPANVTSAIMPDHAVGDLKKLKDLLAKVDYYHTKIVVHRDAAPKYSSSYQCIVHTHTQTHVDIDTVANTTCKYFEYDKDERPIYRSWVLPGQDAPDEKYVLEELHYEHPIIDKNYLEAQTALHKQQGREGLYYGGILAGFNDSHESALSVAIRTAFEIYNEYKPQEKHVAAARDWLGISPVKKTPEAIGRSASLSFNRFSLFPYYLHHLDEMDAQSSQLGAHEEERPSMAPLSS